MSLRFRHTEPVLITDAPRSYEDELAIRKRRYALMMGTRIPLMIAALACSSIPWLAAGLLVLSIPLPWAAVLIANDRLPRRAGDPHRYRSAPLELESSTHRIVDASTDADRSRPPRSDTTAPIVDAPVWSEPIRVVDLDEHR